MSSQRNVYALEGNLMRAKDGAEVLIHSVKAGEIEPDVTRDDMGTLYVNACVLARRLATLKAALEAKYGFEKGVLA